jgi:hypothetical protein
VLIVNATAASEESEKPLLKDLQPVGVTDEKHKNQQYDLLFVPMSGKDYTCRTGKKQSHYCPAKGRRESVG